MRLIGTFGLPRNQQTQIDVPENQRTIDCWGRRTGPYVDSHEVAISGVSWSPGPFIQTHLDFALGLEYRWTGAFNMTWADLERRKSDRYADVRNNGNATNENDLDNNDAADVVEDLVVVEHQLQGITGQFTQWNQHCLVVQRPPSGSNFALHLDISPEEFMRDT